MVAGNEEIRLPEIFQNVLQQIEFFGITEFGDVAAENSEVNIWISIDVFNGLPQIIFGIGERIEVYIAEPGESERSPAALVRRILRTLPSRRWPIRYVS